MNLHGVILAAYRAFCQNSSHLAKHEAKELLAKAVELTPSDEKFILHFKDGDGRAYTLTMSGEAISTHLDAKFRVTDHRLIAVVPA